MAELPDVIRRYFDAVNKEDWDALAELWHDEIEWRAVGARPRTTREDALTYYPRVPELYPEHYDEPTRAIVDGDTVVVEISFEGKTPEGTEVTFEAVDVFDLEDGKIKRFSSWFDIDELRRQLP